MTKKKTTKQPDNKRAYVVGLFGATDTGKSTRAQELLSQEKPGRVVVWDFKREYRNADRHFSRASDLYDYVKAKGKRGRFFVAFDPCIDSDDVRKMQFDAVNKIIQAHGNIFYIVEELKFVTKPTWSPGSWSMITMTGREQNIKIIGTSQRPASVDKDFFSNCTMIHARRLNYEDDITTMAKALRIHKRDMAALTGHDYYERNNRTGELTEKKY